MATEREIKIVVSAQDLGTKKLDELVASLDAIATKNDEISKSGKASATSMVELKQALEDLKALESQLKGRTRLFEGIEKDEKAIVDLGNKISATQTRIKELQSATTGTTKGQAALNERLKKQTAVLATQQAAFERLTGSVKEAKASQEALAGTDFETAQKRNAEALRNVREEMAKTISTQRQQETIAAKSADTAREEAEARRSAEKAAREQAAANKQSAIAASTAAAEQAEAASRAEAAAAEQIQKQRLANAEQERSISVQARLLSIGQRLGLVTEEQTQEYIKNSAAARVNAETAQKNAAAQNQVAVAVNKSGDAARNAANAQGLFADRGKKALSTFQRIRGQVLAMASAYVGLYSVISTGQRAFNVSNERIALQTRLLVANGDDTQRAKQDFEFLRKEADRLGFSLNELGEVYSRLAIAGRAAGLQTSEVRDIFSNFSEVARVNNLGAEETGRVFKALEQILSKGKVQAEELRGQLGDVLPGAFTTFAKSLGVSTAQLDKLLEKGKVSSKELVGFSRTYAETVGGQLPKATGSLRAELGRLTTAFDDFLLVIAEQGMNDAIRDIASELQAFFKSAEGAKAARELASAARDLGAVFLVLAQNLGAVFGILKVGVALFLGQSAAGILGGLGKFAKSLAFVGTAAGTTATALTGLRAVLLTVGRFLGPIGLAVTALASAYFLFRDSAEEVVEPVNEVDRSIKRLSSTTTQAEFAALKLAEAEKAHAEAVKEVEKARKALDAAPKGDSAEAQKTRDKAQANLAHAEAVLKVRAAVVARSEAIKVQKLEDLREMRERNAQLLEEAQNRVKVAQATLAQAEAQVALRETQFQEASGRNLDLAGGQLALAESNANRAKEAVKAARLEVLKFENALGTVSSGPKSRANNGKKPESPDVPEEIDPKEAKKKADEIARIREEAAQASIKLRQDALQQELQADEQALAARLELVQIEYDAKLKANQELAARLRELGLSAEAQTTESQQAEILRQKEFEEAQVRKAYIQNLADKQHEDALKRITAGEDEVNRLIAERDRKLEEIAQQNESGRMSDFDAARASYEIELEYQQKVLDQVQALRDLISTAQADGSLSIKDATEISELLERLDEVPGKVRALDPAISKLRDLQTQLAGGLSDTFVALGKGIADAARGFGSFKDAIKGAWDVFRNFIADFLVGIGRAILQVILLQAIQKAFGKDSILGKAAGLMGGGSFHTGGVVGHSGGTPRAMNPTWFAGAPRFHSGGFPGLRQNEVPAILQRGEEVLTRNDPRHALNGGGAGQSGQKIEINNMIDTGSFAVALGKSPTFKKVVHNILRADKAAVRQLLA